MSRRLLATDHLHNQEVCNVIHQMAIYKLWSSLIDGATMGLKLTYSLPNLELSLIANFSGKHLDMSSNNVVAKYSSRSPLGMQRSLYEYPKLSDLEKSIGLKTIGGPEYPWW